MNGDLLSRFLQHHVLANLAFVLVLVMGSSAYLMLPREKDPTINFNWIQITTAFPGAAAEDVEKLITDPIEEAVAKVSDIRFISSTSRESISSVLVRFNELDETTFDKRVTDLRREVQNAENSELPDEAESPFVFEITTSNAFPTATLVLQGQADDEVLREQARTLEKEMERLAGIERVDAMGLRDPELQVLFDPQRLTGLGVTPTALSDTVAAYFRDVSAGTVRLGGQQWLLRLVGTDAEPGYLAKLPVVTSQGEVPLGSLAEVRRGRERPSSLVSYRGRPTVMLSVFKKANTNTLELVDRLADFIDRTNPQLATRGLALALVDDQTVSTRTALGVMQTNAAVGLALVLLVAWLFLGTRIALLTAIGIPFTLAATFWLLLTVGQTLNNSVLLGVVISLGMLVDDAVVVVEGIYYRLQRGIDVVVASTESLREVFAPVTASVLTTIAAFLPLMLMPGILGQFMAIIPFVVTVALAFSLLEAYWMLPAHVIAARVDFSRPSRLRARRERFTHTIRLRYSRWLIAVLRRPRISLAAVALMFLAAVGAVGAGWIHINFFAMEPFRVFYVNVEMPVGTPVEASLAKAREVEAVVRRHVDEAAEVRGIVSYAGIMFTETEPMLGDQYAQVMVSLKPKTPELREVTEVVGAIRPDVRTVPGPVNVAFMELKDGPPVTKAISVKVRGDEFGTIRAAVADIKRILAAMPAVRDISDDDSAGRTELKLRLDLDAVNRTGLNPSAIGRILRLLADGEVPADFQHNGEKVEVRVQAQEEGMQDIVNLLRVPVALPGGGEIALGDLVTAETVTGRGNIRHYNLRRAITVEADLDKAEMDTVTANRLIQEGWAAIELNHPGINLDFSGELDDIQESLDSIFVLFLFGVGLIYAILGTQFKSYFQPFMILATVPMAFTGVVLGLLITGNPLSLYTLYGVVALAGIAVNAAIVLISAANDRLEAGMSILHATVYAARRRVVPILITSLTTIAGLFSLATGLGGKSLIWGPVATAIVWGLAFSTVLTLFVVPLLYRNFMGRKAALVHRQRAG